MNLLEPVVLCDIDGTIALMGKVEDGRRGPFDWERVGEDDPNKPIIAVLRMMRWTGLGVIFLSGRMEKARELTLDWLDFHVCNPDNMIGLFMREDGDLRADDIVKEEIYRREIEGKYQVKYVLDDRDKVVRMWRRLGLTVLQVADGNF